jgi:hypothetical protein
LLQQLLHLLRHLLLYWMFLFPHFHWTMEPIYLMEHLLVQSYLIQGELEEFHEKKAAIYLIANHFQFNVAKPPFAWHEHYFFHPKWSHLCQYCQP